MGIEIERKFLVDKEKWAVLSQPEPLEVMQGYISTGAGNSVRVRVTGDQAFLTVKGASNGLSRLEFEYPIPLADARQMIQAMCGSRITKLRYHIPFGRHLWEVDVFLGDNEGLIVAEVELASETETPELPAWLGKEVTSEERYYNVRLADFPFRDWQ